MLCFLFFVDRLDVIAIAPNYLLFFSLFRELLFVPAGDRVTEHTPAVQMQMQTMLCQPPPRYTTCHQHPRGVHGHSCCHSAHHTAPVVDTKHAGWERQDRMAIKQAIGYWVRLHGDHLCALWRNRASTVHPQQCQVLGLLYAALGCGAL